MLLLAPLGSGPLLSLAFQALQAWDLVRSGELSEEGVSPIRSSGAGILIGCSAGDEQLFDSLKQNLKPVLGLDLSKELVYSLFVLCEAEVGRVTICQLSQVIHILLTDITLIGLGHPPPDIQLQDAHVF